MTSRILLLASLLVGLAGVAAAGEPPFTDERWIKDGNGKRCLKLADLDQDGDTDVLVIETARGGYSLTTVKWLQNKKRGQRFTERVIDSSLMEGHDLTVGDIDGDGDLDVAVTGNPRNAKPNGGVQWYENLGKGKAWAIHKIDHNGPYGPIRLGDLDGDGDLDVVVGSWSLSAGRKIFAYTNQGKGKTWSQKRTVAPRRVDHKALLVLDYDGDGDQDIVARTESTFSWYENREGSWKEHLITNTKKHLPTSLEAVDFDKDGDLDLVVGARRRVAVYLNMGKGRYGPEELVESGNLISDFRAAAADVDGDGKLDVVVNHPRELVWFSYDADEEDWTAHPIGRTFGFAKFFVVGDMDGDGDPDILRNKDGEFKICWWENTRPKSTK